MEIDNYPASEAAEAVAPDTSPRRPEAVLANLISLTVFALLAVLVLRGGAVVWSSLADEWGNIAVWVALILGIELLPVFAEDQDITWTLDVPLLLAVAVLYPSEIAATIAFVAAFDAREFRAPRVRLVRAISNRAQVALSVYAASLTFGAFGTGLNPLPLAALGVSLALVVDYTVNLGLASLLLALRRGVPWRSVVGKFSIGPRRVFLATFFGYGLLALVMAYLAREAGVWAVAIPLLPTLVARHALMREQRLQRVTRQIQHQERLLERAMDRAIDERQDERMRISGELHDDVLQALTHVVIMGRLISQDKRMSYQAQTDARDLVAASERSLEAVQDVISGLRKSPLGRSGLYPTLQGLVRDMRLDWQIDFRCDFSTNLELRPDAQVLVYQVAREALTNAAKYSRSSQVRLSLRCDGELFELVVEDDGVGFDPEAVDRETHFGVGLMEERTKRLEGALSVAPKQNGTGTRLQARFPLATVRAKSPAPE